jgi:phage tail tape-measure protein
MAEEEHKEHDEQSTQRKQNEDTGRLAGLGAGALSGASVGTAMLPGIGTFAGALVGGLVGSEIGKGIGGAVLSAFNEPNEEQEPQAAGAGQAEDVVTQLEKLAQLRAQGIISEEEFQALKKKIVES